MKLYRRIISFFVAIFILISSVSGASAAGFLEGENDAFILIEKVSDFFRDFRQMLLNFFSIGFDAVDTQKYTETGFSVPGLDDGFIPQGMCYIESEKCFAVSGYMDNKDFSRIYLVRESDGAVGTVVLKGYKGHAGGIASFGDDVYVCSGGNETEGGFIYRLSANELTKSFDAQNGTVETELSDKIGTVCKASFMYASDNMLFVGEFYNRENKVNKSHYKDGNRAWAVGYELPIDSDFSGGTILPDVVLSIPDQVQGMAVTDDKEVVFSTSYGRRNDSVMCVFKDYTEWKKDSVTINETEIPLYISGKESKIMKFKMPALMEGIDYVNGSLYVIFESGANKYSDAKKVIKTSYILDIDAITD